MLKYHRVRIFYAHFLQIYERLQDKQRPSAFQTRLGGAKGMLTLDPKLTGKKIMVRKSMFKFDCNHRKVEVMRRTEPSKIFHQFVPPMRIATTHRIHTPH